MIKFKCYDKLFVIIYDWVNLTMHLNCIVLATVFRVLDMLTWYCIRLFQCSFIAGRILLIFLLLAIFYLWYFMQYYCLRIALLTSMCTFSFRQGQLLPQLHQVHHDGMAWPSLAVTLASLAPSCAQPMFPSSWTNCARCLPCANLVNAFIGSKR